MPTRTATVAPTAVLTGVAHGELLFNTYQPQAGFACATCHYPQLERRLIGPGMTNLATRFPTYGLTMSLDEYLYQAIVQPNEFLAPSDPPYTVGVMPSNYGEIFTESELQDLIAYIKSL
jgi:cytochrome c553